MLGVGVWAYAKMLLAVAVGRPVEDVNVPAAAMHDAATYTARLRLAQLQLTTPAELLASMVCDVCMHEDICVQISSGRYDDALRVAGKYALNTDPVYMHEWQNMRTIGVEDIHTVLVGAGR
jgi:hypothetical protein